MVQYSGATRENFDENNTKSLLVNIEFFLQLDLISCNVDYEGKEDFKCQLKYAIYILDGRREDEHHKHLWDKGRELLDSENELEVMAELFTAHGAMYARLLYSFYDKTRRAISHMTRFMDDTNQPLRSDSS